MLYPFGHRALQSAKNQTANALWCRDFQLAVSFTENLLLKRFETSSPQAKRVDRFTFYPV